jgi:hypothetical protein
MSGKVKAIIAAVLLALAVSISAPWPTGPSVVLAVECESPAGGCG